MPLVASHLEALFGPVARQVAITLSLRPFKQSKHMPHELMSLASVCGQGCVVEFNVANSCALLSFLGPKLKDW